MATYRKLKDEIKKLLIDFYISEEKSVNIYVDKIMILIKKAGLRQSQKNKLK